MLVICLLAVLCAVSAEFGKTDPNFYMKSYNDVTRNDVIEEQELDRLLSGFVENDNRKSDAVKPLQCYTCASTESWETCEKYQKLVTCPVDATHCLTARITIDGEILPLTEYFKGCVSSNKCEADHYPTCNRGSSVACSMKCCDEMLCNNKEQDRSVKRSFTFNCDPPCLLYGSLHQINGIELKTSRKVPGLTSLSHVTPVEVDIATRSIYWSDKIKHMISKTSLVTGESEVVIGGEGGRYEGIAIDWISRLMYWTDRNHKTIEVATLNGSTRRVLIDRDLGKPRAITVDPKYGYMFWTDWGDRPRIERASLSGEHRQALITTDIVWPNGLVLDYASARVYFSESHFHRIESISYDGNNRRVIYSDSTMQPFDLALYHSTLFWSDWDTRSVERLDTNTGKKTGNYGILTVDRIAGVAVLDVTRQPKVDSRCAVNNGGCSHLCFTTGLQSRDCGCPNGVNLLADKMTCDIGLPKTTAQPTSSTRRTTTTIKTTPPTTIPTTTITTTQPPTTVEPTTLKPTTVSGSISVRLVGGALSSEGRVEVRYKGQWGTICDDMWDLRDAMVVCKMLGYPGAIGEFRNGFFGRGKGPIWLDNVNCLGHESNIENCQHPAWGVHNCRHSEDAGVKCRPLQTERPAVPVRLVDGRGPHEGRVEVSHDGQWGTVCDDLWSKQDADVICRMLGYPGAVMATVEASFGSGTGPIWLDNVRCHGHEQSIDECAHQGWGRSNCRHSEDAGVICKPKETVLPTTPPLPVPMQGFTVICRPRGMYVRISKEQLQQMTSPDLDPNLLHLIDSSCGVIRQTQSHILLGTNLNACGTERRQIGDALTFTNKVIVGSNSRFVRRTSAFAFPFRCSYMKTNTRRMLAPPKNPGHAYIGQW